MRSDVRSEKPDQLDRWLATGKWPHSHTRLVDLVTVHSEGGPACDLCCGHALFGEQVRRVAPLVTRMVGAELDGRAISRAHAAGIDWPILQLEIKPVNFGSFAAFLVEHDVRVLLVRRCLRDVLGPRVEHGRDFTDWVVDAGVREVFLQACARRFSSRPSPLGDLEEEIAALGPRLEVVEIVQDTAMLRPVR